MSVASYMKDFALEAMGLDAASVGEDEGEIVITRPLTDERTDTEDVFELVDDHQYLSVINVVVAVQDGEMRVHVEDERAGGDD